MTTEQVTRKVLRCMMTESLCTSRWDPTAGVILRLAFEQFDLTDRLLLTRRHVQWHRSDYATRQWNIRVSVMSSTSFNANLLLADILREISRISGREMTFANQTASAMLS